MKTSFTSTTPAATDDGAASFVVGPPLSPKRRPVVPFSRLKTFTSQGPRKRAGGPFPQGIAPSYGSEATKRRAKRGNMDIQILPSTVADQIAAGEVFQRPESVTNP